MLTESEITLQGKLGHIAHHDRVLLLHKVSSKTRNYSMTVFSYPVRGKQVHRMNVDNYWKNYHLENERRELKKPLYLSNQFIHAYTSVVARDQTRNWSDILIVSDYDRNDCIWRIPLAEIRGLFSVAAHDYPHSVRMLYSKEKGEYEVSTD